MRSAVSLSLLLLVQTSALAYNSTNLADVYAQVGFDPAATNCGVIVQLSDIHMSLAAGGGDAVLTNLDARVVSMVNAITPRPDAIAVTGDVASNVGPGSPGAGPDYPNGTNELTMAKAELAKLTNCGAMYVCPGNHDSVYGDYTGSAFETIFGLSRFTNFAVANLPVVMLDSGNNGVIDQEQIDWLATLNYDRTKPVLAMLHIPIHGGDMYGRESSRELLWWLGKFKLSYVACGHDHGNYAIEFPNRGGHVVEHFCPSTDALGHSMAADPTLDQTAGFLIYCVTNGYVQAVIRAAITNANYYTRVTNETWTSSQQPLKNLTNILFTAEEGHFNRSTYQASSSGGQDCGYWYIYATNYQALLPLDTFTTATRLLVEFNRETTNTVNAYLSTNGTSWTNYAWEFYRDGVGSVVIPVGLRGAPLWFKIAGNGNMFVGGFALGTTATMTAYEQWAGLETGDYRASKWSTSDVSPAFRYALGLHPTRLETTRMLPQAVHGGGWPLRSTNNLTVATLPIRSGVTWSLQSSPSVDGPWTNASGYSSSLTNGYRMVTVTNLGTNFVRLSVNVP